ncbi:hypothetical protein GQ600_9335 [Phytophthora cactorum]|nr:hypothetical protein GQ600_9335 [Phytophthora cactorum]
MYVSMRGPRSSLAADEDCKDRLVCLHLLPGCLDRSDYLVSRLMGPTSGWIGCNESHDCFWDVCKIVASATFCTPT